MEKNVKITDISQLAIAIFVQAIRLNYKTQ